MIPYGEGIELPVVPGWIARWDRMAQQKLENRKRKLHLDGTAAGWGERDTEVGVFDYATASEDY